MSDAIRILLVEDNPDHELLVRENLARDDAQYEIRSVGLLSGARQALAEDDFDLVLADWRLPDGEGHFLLDAPQEEKRFPLVLMTSQGNESVAVDAMRRGALDYVVKTPDALRDMPHTVRRALRAWEVECARAHAEEQVRFRSLVLDQISDTVITTDLEGRILYGNAAFCAGVGMEVNEDTGMTVSDLGRFFRPDVSHEDVLRITIENGDWRGSMEGLSLPTRYMDVRTCLIHGPDGQPVGACGVATDVTDRRRAEMQARALQGELDSIVRSVPDTIYRLDPSGRITFASGSIRRFGYHSARLVGTDLVDLIVSDDRPALREMISGPFEKAGDTRILETSIRRPDGGAVPVEIISRPLYASTSSGPSDAGVSSPPEFLGTQGLVRDISQGKQAEEDIHLLTRELIRAQESERLRISLELHDNVAQELAVARIACDSVGMGEADLPESTREGLEKISRLIETSISSIRGLARALRPPGLDELGLQRAVSQHCTQFSSDNGVYVDFQATGIDNLQLSYEAKIHIYRLVQECLTNIRKHANATYVKVRLVASSPHIILRIRDNGRGFSPEGAPADAAGNKRMGIRGMQERVHILGGRMDIQSQPGHGTEPAHRNTHPGGPVCVRERAF